MPINKQSIQSLIIDGDLGKAIKQLLELGRDFSPDLLNETTLLSARFNSLERDKRSGLISSDNAAMRYAQITHSLTYLLEKVAADWAAPGGDEPPAGTPASAVNAPGKVSELNILFLAANPRDITRLRVDEECRKIEQALERSKYRDKIRLVSKGAVQIPDLRRALMDYSPNILHFSGHGSELGRIYLEDTSGNGREVPVEALANLLRLFKDQLKCVVLNACYSEIQADEIIKYGIPVIGMTTKVPDKAGIEFSEAFYDALGAGKDLDFAFELGCSAISMADLPGAEAIPVLKKPA